MSTATTTPKTMEQILQETMGTGDGSPPEATPNGAATDGPQPGTQTNGNPPATEVPPQLSPAEQKERERCERLLVDVKGRWKVYSEQLLPQVTDDDLRSAIAEQNVRNEPKENDLYPRLDGKKRDLIRTNAMLRCLIKILQKPDPSAEVQAKLALADARITELDGQVKSLTTERDDFKAQLDEAKAAQTAATPDAAVIHARENQIRTEATATERRRVFRDMLDRAKEEIKRLPESAARVSLEEDERSLCSLLDWDNVAELDQKLLTLWRGIGKASVPQPKPGFLDLDDDDDFGNGNKHAEGITSKPRQRVPLRPDGEDEDDGKKPLTWRELWQQSKPWIVWIGILIGVVVALYWVTDYFSGPPVVDV